MTGCFYIGSGSSMSFHGVDRQPVVVVGSRLLGWWWQRDTHPGTPPFLLHECRQLTAAPAPAPKFLLLPASIIAPIPERALLDWTELVLPWHTHPQGFGQGTQTGVGMNDGVVRLTAPVPVAARWPLGLYLCPRGEEEQQILPQRIITITNNHQHITQTISLVNA